MSAMTLVLTNIHMVVTVQTYVHVVATTVNVDIFAQETFCVFHLQKHIHGIKFSCICELILFAL